MSKIKLSFCWDWNNPWSQMLTWKDGLSRAIYLLSREWDVKCYSIGEDTTFHHDYFPITLKPTPELLAEEILKNKPDAMLVFGDMTRPTIPHLAHKGIPMALCLAGGTFRDYADCFDLFFVESEVYKNQLEAEGRKVIKAFGTNTELFKPIKQPKIWDAIFPATFANWKRHNLFTEAVGDKGLACGLMYDTHETECWQICQDNGTMILPHLSHRAIAYLMNSAKTCVITADSTGGCQRTVLEAMACNIPVIAMSDSDKTTEYIKGCGVGEIVGPDPNAIREAVENWKNKEVNTRQFILDNYSAEIYANKLKEGLLSICQKSQ